MLTCQTSLLSVHVCVCCLFIHSAGKDFVPLHKVLHFEAGEVDITVEVAIKDNTMQESDRLLKVILMETGQASVALAEMGREVVVTIHDDDGEFKNDTPTSHALLLEVLYHLACSL